ncbi:gluconate 2-dehydrogenase subunit 3 family protein [Pedobacter foliorum]|uniref:gluconate 2-dehydrogenase subunit 3 family protein n=1 Tax=Pedobacter foliorum TaxID=2739058 RepID=UPI0015675B33|nr:gluconate 2-dehydrogenase subunit 3 family protein [Pedobacter foliorum]NRF38049.1 gluconate 2-dehydrogenase subunit 3 family protein [Pedobacter foliorum]
MNRREAIRNVAFLMGGALSATTIGVFLGGCNSPSTATNIDLFTNDQLKLITEISDIIIPDTSSPGAKAAGVGPFIALMVKDCYPQDAQEAFVEGLDKLEKQARDQFSKSFLELSQEQRTELLGKLREETLAAIKTEQETLGQQKSPDVANDILPKEKPKTVPRFFSIVRDLTLLGYFTSKIGATQAYEYIQIPGRYDGCVDLKPGQRVWAS